MEELSAEDKARYARHLTLPQIGAEGQAQLKASKVFCVVAGGLGSPALLYLAAAGIGHLSICLLYTSPSPRDVEESRMPSSA